MLSALQKVRLGMPVSASSSNEFKVFLLSRSAVAARMAALSSIFFARALLQALLALGDIRNHA
jgi:hypothetical protein